MATTDRDRGNLETRHLPVEPTDAVVKRGRLMSSDWLFYSFAGATAVTFLGALALIWGDNQGNLAMQTVGMCLLLAGCVVWTVAFTIMTWWMVRDAGLLLWRGAKQSRKRLPKKAADDGIES